VTPVINSRGCDYFLPGLRLPLRLHNITAIGCQQFILFGALVKMVVALDLLKTVMSVFDWMKLIDVF